jgi:NDP-sugar pyrophosphorylase family protein
MSWKKYGGTNNLENLNNIVVNSIVADVLSLRQFYIGNWDICGSLLVKDDATIYRNALIHGNLDISGANTEIRGNAKISRNTEISGNLVVYDNTYLKKYLYFDPCGNTLVHGKNNAFGFNKYNPTATIDISSDQIYTVKMKTSQNQASICLWIRP